jgi:hypothetical protein
LIERTSIFTNLEILTVSNVRKSLGKRQPKTSVIASRFTPRVTATGREMNRP